ncbi:TrkH-domain-containing protein [Acephala macrosclerotiorum]|nr:TrkH-domain-containing protein [Acephala macrosclerotiorum]
MSPSPRYIKRVRRIFNQWLPPLNFISVHYIYFIATCLISGVIFWGSSTPPRKVTFIDSIFLTTSAMTEAGLNTINLSTLNTFQQFIIFLLMLLGSSIFVSAFVTGIRSRAFEIRFKEVLEEERQKRESNRSKSRSILLLPLSRSGTAKPPAEKPPNITPELPLEPRETFICVPGGSDQLELPRGDKPNINGDIEAHRSGCRAREGETQVNKDSAVQQLQQQPQPQLSDPANTSNRNEENLTKSFDGAKVSPPLGGKILQPRQKHHRSFFSAHGIGARFAHIHITHMQHPAEKQHVEHSNTKSNIGEDFGPYSFAYRRNSELAHLTRLQRRRLGGVEYHAIRILVWLVPAYFILSQLFGCIGLGAWITANRPSVARSNGLNPFWAGAFNGVSAFNNNGYSLIDANMTAFQTSDYMLITMALMILAGNTCYPVFLRIIVWALLKLTPERWSEQREALRFLLAHPRRCYTNLFPTSSTWWLLISVIVLNGIDWAGFLILNIGNRALDYLPLRARVIDGLFQATAVRSGGFYVVPIPSLRIGTQFLYTIMMYISAFPVTMTMRSTNVYEERSLGIYADDVEHDRSTKTSRFLGLFRKRISRLGEGTGTYFLRQQLRAQLAHDLWWLALAVLFIMVIETSQFERDPKIFSVFNVIFEVVSGYGCVGISVGVPWDQYSFCGAWHTLSKLILCAVMLRGRHRGLPVVIDMAVLLPGERLDRAEEEDARIRLERRVSRSMEA